MTEEQKSFKQIVEYRKEKLEKLISKGDLRIPTGSH